MQAAHGNGQDVLDGVRLWGNAGLHIILQGDSLANTLSKHDSSLIAAQPGPGRYLHAICPVKVMPVLCGRLAEILFRAILI